MHCIAIVALILYVIFSMSMPYDWFSVLALYVKNCVYSLSRKILDGYFSFLWR